jgi:hypothetical protein
MIKIFYILAFFLIFFSFLSFIGCKNEDGLFGHSGTKEEAKANGSTVVEYVPDKINFDLLDGTRLEIDTAWTEISFTYRNSRRILDSAYGFHFGIPYKIKNEKNFTFIFNLVDTSNQVFTNGRENKTCYLCPKILYEEMKVMLQQKNPDTSKGWMQPIITDTIIFTKIK